VIGVVGLKYDRRRGAQKSVRNRDQSSSCAGRDNQFQRTPVGIYGNAVEQGNLFGDGPAQLIDAFEEAVVIEASGDDFIQRSREIGVKRKFTLSLHKIAAGFDKTRDGAYIGLGAPCRSLQLDPPKENWSALLNA